MSVAISELRRLSKLRTRSPLNEGFTRRRRDITHDTPDHESQQLTQPTGHGNSETQSFDFLCVSMSVRPGCRVFVGRLRTSQAIMPSDDSACRYASSPCWLMSSPLVSSSAVARSGITRPITFARAKLTTKL